MKTKNFLTGGQTFSAVCLPAIKPIVCLLVKTTTLCSLQRTPNVLLWLQNIPVCLFVDSCSVFVCRPEGHSSVCQPEQSVYACGQDHLYLVFLYTIMYMSVCLFVRTLGMSVGQNTLGNCLSRKQRRQVAISRYSCWGGVEGAPNPNPI